jgi:NADPH-dependent 2,4-dienoyl-CoA reductase/sulfur reductase-like enzyme
MRYLILGSGPAGIGAAKAIRKRERAAEVIIATEGTDAPYLTPLLTNLISGETDMKNIADPQGEDLADRNIDVVYGKRATGVDTGGRNVTFTDGSSEPYDRLLIATGGKPILSPPLMKHPDSVFPLNTLADALSIKKHAQSAKISVVYGPGFLAIEACRAMRATGHEVVWFKPDLPKHGYPIALGEFESRFLDEVRNKGIAIKEGSDIVAVEDGEESRIAVRSTEGETVYCDMIVAATERTPSVDFLEGSGVDFSTGILVDDYLQTSAPDVYAAGDCAELFDVEYGKKRINFGWRSAIKQGQLAGENMAGRDKRYIRKSEDYFWLIFGPSLQDRLK